MEYDSQKANREKLVAKAQHSAAAPFFNFVTENWCKVAAARPSLDGKEVQEVLWQQWMGLGTMGRGGKEDLTAGKSDACVAIASVKREKSVKRKKVVVNLEKVKLEGRQVEANRGESEIKEESLTFFKELIGSELERVAPSRDPHQGVAGDLDDIKRAAAKAERVKAEAVKKAADENSRQINLSAEEAERWMEEKKQEEEKRRKEIQGKEEKRKTEVARLKKEKAKADQKEKTEQKMREERKRSLEIKQPVNFVPTTPPHTPNSNITSTTAVSSHSMLKEAGEVGSHAELKRIDEQTEISQEDLDKDSSFDSEVK